MWKKKEEEEASLGRGHWAITFFNTRGGAHTHQEVPWATHTIPVIGRKKVLSLRVLKSSSGNETLLFFFFFALELSQVRKIQGKCREKWNWLLGNNKRKFLVNFMKSSFGEFWIFSSSEKFKEFFFKYRKIQDFYFQNGFSNNFPQDCIRKIF